MRHEFWFFSISLVSLRLADIAVTYAVSPDLRWEINPLVSIAGFGWFALLLANFLGVTAVIVLLYYSLSKASEDDLPESGYSLKEFISHYLFGDKESFQKIYYVVPYNKMAIVRYSGYVSIRVLTIWSLIIVIHNLLVWHSEAFRNMMSDWLLWLSIYALLVFLVVVFSVRFFRLLYMEYNFTHKTAPPQPG